MLFAVLRHEDVHAQCDPSGARYDYNEVLLAAFVREKGLNPIGRMGLYPICLYVDDDTAMAAGREIYGFPKKMARIELGAHEMSLVRCGLSPEAAAGPVATNQVDELSLVCKSASADLAIRDALRQSAADDETTLHPAILGRLGSDR